MGTTLTGTTPQDTYDSLIKVTDNGPLSGTAKYLSDGLGNDSVLALSTSALGIGTASPDARLTALVADNAFAAKFKATNGVFRILPFETGLGVKVSAVNGAENAFASLVSQGSDHQFVVGVSEAMRITSAGNVGIGTGSPATKLEVNEAAAVAQATLSGIASTEGAILNLKNRAAKQFSANRNIVQIDNYLYTDASPTTGGMTQIKSGHTASGLNSSFISFSTSPNDGNLTERVRVTNDGLTFNGDTAAANALDDYEEGTWTPTVVGTTGTATYTTREGHYTKIGRQVTATFFISFQKATIAGSVTLASLPFTVGNLGNQYPQAAILIDNLASAYDNPILQLNNGDTSGFLLINNGSTVSHAAMDASQLGAGTMTFRGTATYFV